MYNTYTVQKTFNQLFLLPVVLLLNSRQVVVKFWGRWNLRADF